MPGGKGKKTIDKVLEVRREEENQAALEAAARNADVERAKESLAAAEEELKARAAKVRGVSSAIRSRFMGGIKGAELAMAQAHLDVLKSDLEKADALVSRSKTALDQAHLALTRARDRLKRKSAHRRVAEKYTGRLARREREEKEKREEKEE